MMMEALVRELREEVGVTPSETSFLVSLRDPNAPADDPATYHMYMVTDWGDGEPGLVGDEHTDLTWFRFDIAANLRDLELCGVPAVVANASKRPEK